MTEPFAILDYLRHHCLPALLRQAGLSEDRLRDLIAAGCLPEPTYRVAPALSIRSAIRAEEIAPQPEEWFGLAVLPWARRAAAAPLDPAVLADRMRQEFAADFRNALLGSDGRTHGWTELFDTAGDLDEAAFGAAGDRIWEEDWLSGAYAVCLKRFDGHHLVTKLVERSRIRALTDDAARPDLTLEEAAAVTAAMARLDAVLTPFAPHERPHGTPGLWIDRIAARYGLLHPTTAEDTTDGAVDSGAAAA